jgi:hypothetical protein
MIVVLSLDVAAVCALARVVRAFFRVKGERFEGPSTASPRRSAER